MRSRTEAGGAWSVWVERVLRIVGVGTLAFALFRAVMPTAVIGPARSDDPEPLPSTADLAAQLTDPARRAYDVLLDHAPDAETRALLHAARHAGLPVTWRGATANGLPALVLSAEPRADPNGGTVVRLAAPDGLPVQLEDSLGWIDSTMVEGGGASWIVPGAARRLTVRSGDSRASVNGLARAPGYRARLFAAPGWEARFTTVALEEAGWTVDAAFTIAPRVSVRSGQPGSVDTSRYDVVVALDSTAWRESSAIARFVREGGGLIVFAEAVDGAPAALPRVGRAAALSPAVPGALRTDEPLDGLPLRAVTGRASGSVVLERSARPGEPVSVAAQVVGAGRVVQVGHAALWEWRMLGGDGADQAHRGWWQRLMQRASPSADTLPSAAPPPALASPDDPAPFADLVARLGPAGEAPSASLAPAAVPAPLSPWLFLLAAGCLLGDWWLRRWRGAR